MHLASLLGNKFTSETILQVQMDFLAIPTMHFKASAAQQEAFLPLNNTFFHVLFDCNLFEMTIGCDFQVINLLCSRTVDCSLTEYCYNKLQSINWMVPMVNRARYKELQ